MNMHFLTRTHMYAQRFEVFLAVLLPFFLIIESAMANAWAYAGGGFNVHDVRTYIALGRGLFFEVLTYSAAKLVRVLLQKAGKGAKGQAVLVGLVGAWAIVVSAGNNLGWVAAGHELGGLFASVGSVLPHPMFVAYEYGLGLLLPLSVGAIAFVDMGHLVEHAFETAELDNRALAVHESEMHRTAYLKAQKRQRKSIQTRYNGVAEKRADSFATRVEQGDMTFNTAALKPAPGLRRVAAPASAPVSAHASIPAQKVVVSPNSPSSGNTQPIVIPGVQPQGKP